ncbi:MAG: response regulator, partial [Burkholderiaceae bacterium]|nr:response regulator [Burkholderiaceae bacterium]
MRILLAEDDPLLGDGLRAGLRQLGFQVDWVRDGLAAEREARAQSYAAAVLDLGLPKLDGMDVLAAWRRAGLTLPVLVLTARDALSERIRGLDAGADDYVIKPVDLHELAARLRAL